MKKKPFARIEPRYDAGAAASQSQARLSPLAAALIQSLGPTGEASPAQKPLQAPPRKLLLRRAWRGVTVSRYADGLEIVFSDGRKLAAASVWKLLLAMVQQRKV